MQNCYSIKARVQNEYYVNLLKILYNGENGESFCLFQFLIYSNNLSDFENDITKTLYEISKDDLLHLKKIGDLIIQFGGKLENENWNKKYNFSKKIEEIIKNLIKIKENCLINYKIIRNKIPNLLINKALQEIIIDEQKHCELLKNIISSINN